MVPNGAQLSKSEEGRRAVVLRHHPVGIPLVAEISRRKGQLGRRDTIQIWDRRYPAYSAAEELQTLSKTRQEEGPGGKEDSEGRTGFLAKSSGEPSELQAARNFSSSKRTREEESGENLAKVSRRDSSEEGICAIFRKKPRRFRRKVFGKDRH
ncbi:hypothetical protein U1Q18_033312 [Sarracenia purpurea var. burkii]